MYDIKDLSVTYSTGDYTKVAIDRISLSIPSSGYSLGIVGESGSGKTTLGMAIMNLIEPPGRISTGTIECMGKNILEFSKKDLRNYRWNFVSMVYQSAMNSLNPVKTIADHITEVIRAHRRISKREARKQALDLLSKVGIKEDRVDNYPHEFSGGMRQRAVIAMALALSPKLLIADEPTSALDVVVQMQILALLKKLVEENKLSLIFITHEIAILGGLVENVAIMHKGEIVESGPLDEVFKQPLHPYSEMLLGSVLSLDSEKSVIDKFVEFPKESYTYYEKGCKFANRCKYAFEKCRAEAPKFLEVKNRRFVACHKYQ